MDDESYEKIFKGRGVSRETMIKLDRTAIEDYSIPGLILMENAGRNVAEEALQELENNTNNEVAIICGKGNNGGDGFVIARHLFNFGYEVKVYLLAKVNDILGENDAGLNLKILQNMDIKINEVLDDSGVDSMIDDIKNCALFIDAIFGTGLKGDLREPAKSIIKKINPLDPYVISVDIPSGLDCDEGKVLGECIIADKTVTFALPKKGFFINSGPEYVGDLIVTDISIPKSLIDKFRN